MLKWGEKDLWNTVFQWLIKLRHTLIIFLLHKHLKFIILQIKVKLLAGLKIFINQCIIFFHLYVNFICFSLFSPLIECQGIAESILELTTYPRQQSIHYNHIHWPQKFLDKRFKPAHQALKELYLKYSPIFFHYRKLKYSTYNQCFLRPTLCAETLVSALFIQNFSTSIYIYEVFLKRKQACQTWIVIKYLLLQEISYLFS